MALSHSSTEAVYSLKGYERTDRVCAGCMHSNSFPEDFWPHTCRKLLIRVRPLGNQGPSSPSGSEGLLPMPAPTALAPTPVQPAGYTPLPSFLMFTESIPPAEKHQNTQDWVLSQQNEHSNPFPLKLLPLTRPLAPPSSSNESIAIPKGPQPINGRFSSFYGSSFIGKAIMATQQITRPRETNTKNSVNVLGQVLRGTLDLFGGIFARVFCIADLDDDQHNEEEIAMNPMAYLTDNES